jgi:hypothetical protein
MDGQQPRLGMVAEHNGRAVQMRDSGPSRSGPAGRLVRQTVLTVPSA